MLTQIINRTESSEVEQSSAVLDTVANYLTELANFVANSNVTINSDVSLNLTSPCRLTHTN